MYCKNRKTGKVFQLIQQFSLTSSELLLVPVSQLPKNCKIIYCGRPSIFGNPFSHLDETLAKFKVDSREEAISKYEKYLEQNSELKEAIHEQILKPYKSGQSICLECFCLPQKCHCEVIWKHSLLKNYLTHTEKKQKELEGEKYLKMLFLFGIMIFLVKP